MTEPKSNVEPLATTTFTTRVNQRRAEAAGTMLDALAREGLGVLFQVVALELSGGGVEFDVPVLATVSCASAVRLRDDLAASGLAARGYRVDVFDPSAPTGWRPLP